MEGQVSLSTLFGTLRVCINGSFFGYFYGLERSTFQGNFVIAVHGGEKVDLENAQHYQKASRSSLT